MGVTNYMTVNGKIRSEHRSGEAHSRDYVLDRLGSVIQIYQNGWPIADACYEPYGGIYTQWNMSGKTFTWLGGWGYRQTGVEWSSVYVRARHYSPGMSNWTSIDPLWPSEMAYGYVENRVMTGVDPSGMSITDVNCNKGKLINFTCAKMVNCFASPKCKSDFKKCVGGGRDVQALLDAILSNLNDLCGGNYGPPAPGRNTCIVCHSKLSREIRDKCSCSGIEAATLRPFISGIVPSQGIPDDQNNGQTIPSCADARPAAYQPCYLSLLSSGLLNGKQCDAVVLNCNDRDTAMAGTLLHELVHVLGVGAGMGHGKNKSEFVDRIDRCLRSVVLKK